MLKEIKEERLFLKIMLKKKKKKKKKERERRDMRSHWIDEY
jgi:hypothetical protein